MSDPRASCAACATCGAPDDGERVHCKFCNAPLSAEIAKDAIPCPRCNTLCRWGKEKCVACAAWIVVSCIFCGALSPHTCPSCLKCNEAFAGAPERRAERERAREIAQVEKVASVAAPLLGGVLGAIVRAELDDD